MTTPNMLLSLPTVSVTAGPAWASALNAAFALVDTHDHSSGKGVLVPTAGLNINADLSFASYNATGLRTARFASQSGTPSTASDLGIVYVKAGELNYRDLLGQEVAITSAGSIVGATGSISGLVSPASASYNPATGIFSFLKDTGKPGKAVLSDLALSEYNVASANTVTLKSPGTLATSYSVTFPAAVPGQSAPVVMSTGGVLSLGWQDGNVTTPGAAFAGQMSTGLYRPAGGQLAVATAGINATLFTSNGTLVGDGSTSAASFGFINDSDTGFYSEASGSAGFTSNGTAVGRINGNGYATTVGDAVHPGYAFIGDSQTGFYRAAAGQIGLASAGTQIGLFNNNGLYGQTGSAAIPSLSFFADTDTGFYRSASNQIGFTGGGVSLGTFDSVFLDVVPQIRTAAALTAGTSVTAGTTLQTASGGAWKCKIFTGSIAGATVISLTPGGTVVGVFGYAQFGVGTQFTEVTSNSAESDVVFSPSSSSSTVIRLQNTAGTARTYNVIAFYQ